MSFNLARPGPTVLTGANGTGKSTILRIIHLTLSGYWLDLLRLPFAAVRLHFEGHPTVWIEKDPDADALTIGVGERSWELNPFDLDFIDLDDVALRRRSEIRTLGPQLLEFEGRRHTRHALQQLLSIREAAHQTGDEWLIELPGRFPVTFITDQRLIVDAEEPRRRVIPGQRLPTRSRRVVAEYARDLAAEISDSLSRYAEASQNLDRRFPLRVVDAMAAGSREDPARLRERLEAVEKQRRALEAVGLLRRDAAEAFVDASRLEDASISPVIEVYAEDTLDKFEVLADLQRRLEVFVSFLNAHYTDKQIEIGLPQGFHFLLEDGSQLGPSLLSSGEQQILVLAYQILFRAEPGTLIMVDEPELSLHVLWQSTLVDDLAAMAYARDLNLILATHSPTLVGDREELRRSLDPERPGGEVTEVK